jgi:YVTN family beta-propeller protein
VTGQEAHETLGRATPGRAFRWEGSRNGSRTLAVRQTSRTTSRKTSRRRASGRTSVTDRERERRALLDRVEDERDRVRADRFRRSVRLVAWSLVAAAPVAVIAWIMDGSVIAAHPFWTGVSLGAVVLAGRGVSGDVLGWLGARDADVARLREAHRDHRDDELDGWAETGGEDLRDRRRLLDDLDDARDDLRRTVRQLIGSGAVVAVFAGAVAAEAWWIGGQWPTVWPARLLVLVTVVFGVPAMEVLVSVVLARRLAPAKANLLAARRRHRETALYDEKPSDDRAAVAELPPVKRSGWAVVVPAVCGVACMAVLATSDIFTGTDGPAAPSAAATPGLSTMPTVPAARQSPVPVDWPSGVAVSPDGRRAFVANSGPPDRPDADVAVVDLRTQAVTATVPVPPHPMALALTPDGRRLVVAGTGSSAAPAGTLSIVDTATRHVVSTVRLQSIPSDVTVTPDGRTAWCVIAGASGDEPGAAVAVDLATAAVAGVVPVGTEPDAVAVAPDGGRAYVANFGDNSVSVIDTTTRGVVATVDAGAGPSGLVVDQRRHTVWVADQDDSDVHRALTAIDTTTLAPVPVDLGSPAPGVGGPSPLALTPDGRHLLVGRSNPGSDPHPLLDIVDPGTRRVTGVVTMPAPYRIATTPDSHHALTASGYLWVVDIP